MKSLLAVTCLSLFIAGCATTFKPWQLSEIQEGMTREQVVGTLGEPDSSVNKDGAEYLYYSYSEDLSPATAAGYGQDNMDRKAEMLSQSLTTTKYEVVLMDGKLVNYKELKD
ncbi:outer membrane protein assembly factor BamE [Pontiellaceae bacterium B12227]|nr:outer membrane protein assembly factor BamE [Pontiellaceae bacterium B12227]